MNARGTETTATSASGVISATSSSPNTSSPRLSPEPSDADRL